MRKLIAFCAIVFIAYLCIPNVEAAYIDSIITGDKFIISEDTIVSDAAVIDTGQIKITNPIYLENNGTINGDVFICDNCDLVIRNSGDISGTFYSGNNSHITQVVKTSDDITFLDFGGSVFSVLVRGDEVIQLSDVLSIAAGADKITLENTSIMLGADSERPRFFSFQEPIIELVGKITIKLDNLDYLSGRPILSNVSGDALIYAYASNLDPLYLASTYFKGSDLYVKIIRETDYVKILGPDRGHFLNTVRNIIPDDPTISELDNAQTMDDVNNIINHSIMFNPINLMRPIKQFNYFEMNSFKSGPDVGSINPDFGFETIYLMADNMTLKATKISGGIMSENLDISVSAYAGLFDQSYDINEFAGIMYGGNIQVEYRDKSSFVKTKAGFTLSEFETGIIFDGHGPTSNPNGVSVYGSVDFGTIYNFDTNFSITPFLGLIGEHDKILNQVDSSVSWRAGTSAGYGIEENGMRYDYEVRISMQTDKTVMAGIRIFFWSSADLAGGGVSYTLIKDSLGIANKLAFDVRFVF